MDFPHGIIMLLCIFMLEISQTTQGVDVTTLGAKGDGKSDDTQAFVKAWSTVCKGKGSNPTVVVPKGTFLVHPVEFQGPCSASVTFQLSGTIIAPSQDEFEAKEKWISFNSVTGLDINGNGGFDGFATTGDWWKTLGERPAMLRISGCKQVSVTDLTFVRPPRSHISISDSSSVTVENINIKAPENSPNTDGIDITRSSGINIRHSTIQTGDDCISVSSGSSHVNITNINCGPGHGISIGSLGRGGNDDETVEYVHVQSCTFTGTDNAARIKTYNDGSGYARFISYEDITLINTKNPIIIDQNYCPQDNCKEKSSKIKISDLSFIGFRGTTATKNAINFDCSPASPCENIKVEDINLKPSSDLKEPMTSNCNNAHGSSSCSSCTPPVNCLTDVMFLSDEIDQDETDQDEIDHDETDQDEIDLS